MNHGHVRPNLDGSKARCGGPRLCNECAAELAAYLAIPKDGNNHSVRSSIPHIQSEKCWCRPVLVGDYTSEGGVKHYMHNEVQ